MRRLTLPPRPNWHAWADKIGFSWHSEGGACTWNESAAYALTRAEAAGLRRVAEEVHAMYLTAAETVVRQGWWRRLGIPAEQAPLLRASYDRDDWSLTGRFDLMLDENGATKLVEYNSDTALTLVETAVVQREWLRDVMPGHDQFNELHECLVAGWRRSGHDHVHLSWRPRYLEVEHTMRYMASLVREAGLKATLIALHCLGWDAQRAEFVDGDGHTVRCCYKMYPWDWLLEEEFAQHLPATNCRFVEPAWRHLLSSKGMLAVLWELFPDHPALLPCYDTATQISGPFVTKPLFGRQGQNITIHSQTGVLQQSGGEFKDEPCVHQQMAASPRYDGFIPQFGVWVVNDQAVALGMRETDSLIINAYSPFTPHFIETT